MSSSGLTPAEVDRILTECFNSWRSYKLIVARLREVHGLDRSLSWLKAQYKRLRLFRRPTAYSPLSLVRNCIKKELRTSCSLLGYRQMWKRLRDKYDLVVKRDTVMMEMRQLDAEGVSCRRSHRLCRRVYFSKGPNFIWHLDGYDKLSAYGFCIHGCIDGFSRRLMWLRIGSTNHDPSVILQYYLDVVERINGCPSIIRMDKGTENVHVATVQYALRSSHTDGFACEKSFRYGSSPANIRIESFWSQLRRHKTGWWIKALKSLEQEGYYNRSITHKKCLHVVFFGLIEREIAQFMTHWNSHVIRASRNGDCLGGIPNDLYDMPTYYGTEDYLKSIDDTIIGVAKNDAYLAPSLVDDDFYLMCTSIAKTKYGLAFDLHRDISVDNCLDLYTTLFDNIPS